MTLTEFLLARVAEDEGWAESVRGDWPSQGSIWFPLWSEVPASPQRVLAECVAKRLLIESAQAAELLIMAAVYADHPDYDSASAISLTSAVAG